MLMENMEEKLKKALQAMDKYSNPWRNKAMQRPNSILGFSIESDRELIRIFKRHTIGIHLRQNRVMQRRNTKSG